MGIEYYLVDSKRKELFYLGKHIEIPSFLLKKNNPIKISFKYFYNKFLEDNPYFFDDMGFSMKGQKHVIEKVYDWCMRDDVYFSNDCCQDTSTWGNWKVTEDICKIIEETLKEDSFIVDVQALNLALELFDGDENKAKILLDLIQNSYNIVSTPKNQTNMEMNIPDEEKDEQS